MNKKHGFLFGFAVIAIAAIFTLAGCDDGSGDDPNGDDKGGGGKALSSIGIKYGTPDKKTFFVGDKFDTTGLVLNVSYTDGSNEDVSEGFTTEPAHDTELTEASSSKTVTVSYTSGGVTETATYTITVSVHLSQAHLIGIWEDYGDSNEPYFEIANDKIEWKDSSTEEVYVTYTITSWGEVESGEGFETIEISGSKAEGAALSAAFLYGITPNKIYLKLDSFGLTFGYDADFTSFLKVANGNSPRYHTKKAEED